jgi:dihydrofolate synthase/folylpolyglutamate synthase
MHFDESLSYLLSLGHETLTLKLGLRNTETLLTALGNPERSFPAVQIAGTNGKGSTAAFLDSICRAAGIHTGLFTSPHLISITERIKIDGRQISEDQFAELTSKVKQTAEKLVAGSALPALPTFFEHVTAIALLAFREAKVELAILETGLGGRLDSTTAAAAALVAITPIAFDHQEYLGNTLAQIAAEKAAIIRPGVAAAIAPQAPEAFRVIVRQCEAAGIQPCLIESRGAVAPAERRGATRWSTNVSATTADGRAIASVASDHVTYENLTVALRGRHQVVNAATAVGLAELLLQKGFHISKEAIVHGIETATHPGRLELWEGSRRILFDGAHNPAAAHSLREYLDEFVTSPIVMIFGTMRDKAVGEMMAGLFTRADKVILTSLDNPRAASVAELLAALPKDLDEARVMKSSDIEEAIELALKITPANGILCVTGSLHLVGVVQEILSRATAATLD